MAKTVLDIMEEKIGRLDAEIPTMSDFTEMAKKIAEESDKRLSADKEEMNLAAQMIASKMLNLYEDILKDYEERKVQLTASEQAQLQRIEEKLAAMESMVSERVASLKDGESPEVEVIVQAVLPNIPVPKDGSPDAAEDIRNKLELLDGDERLDVSAIRGLEEKIKEMTPKSVGGTQVVGHIQHLNERILDVAETPDGIITAYTFATKPVIIKVNGVSYREGKGWSWDGTQATIDFAPATGSDIWGEI